MGIIGPYAKGGDRLNRKKYDEMILHKIEKSLNLLLPMGAFIALLSALLIFFSDRSDSFIYLDAGISGVLIMLYIFRNRLSAKFKIGVIGLITFLLGVVSILLSGFSGTGIILFVLSSLVVVGFLAKKTGAYFCLLNVSVLIFIPILLTLGIVKYEGYNSVLQNSPVEWLIHLVGFALLEFVIYVVINSIKDYLVQTITDTETYSERIYKLAFFDQLTGLSNKNMFFETLTQNEVSEGILVIFSIKGLNLINSIYGSEVGDRMLKMIAKTMLEKVDDPAQLARTAGSEFVWYYKDSNIENMLTRFKDFETRVHQSESEIESKRIIRFYGGYVKINDSRRNMDQYYQMATIALEQAKAYKDSMLLPYDAETEKRFRYEEQVKALLNTAINNREFTISYQEKKDSNTRETIGVEALARWHSKELGQVSPGVFIPIIEKSNLTVTFGNLIVKQVLDEYERLCVRYGKDISVSINISPVHLSSPLFVDNIIKIVNAYEVPPNRIIFEVTEEALIDNVEMAIGVIKELRNLGFKISLDDFGTGFSSLNYLSRLEVDELKIDRSFVKQLDHESKTSVLLQAIINLKETYGFSVVAEGVETQSQCDILNRLGCSNIQGYLFSIPTPLE